MASSNSNNIKIVISAEDKASKPLRNVADAADDTTNKTSRLGRILSTGLKVGIGAATAGVGTLTTGLTLAAKASYSQVKAVEEARFGLVAYEKDGKKVDKVLNGLVSYAKSDMGVLFNRKDMFAAASTLKMYGNETGTLTERVKILSKGVAQGKTTFQELSAIVGRAAAKGRLDAVDFDMLIERGIGLDRKFRGAKVSANELWKELNKALPDKLLAGRANTIEGRMIRLQSAFRGVGDAVLGVDSKTSNFVEGGLGDRIQKGIGGLTDFLRGAKPKVEDAVKNIIGAVDLLQTGKFKDGMFSSAIKEDGKFVGILKGIRNAATEVYNYLAPKFQSLASTVSERLMPAFSKLWNDVLAPFSVFAGGALVFSLGLVLDGLNLIAGAVSWVVTEIQNGNPWVVTLAGAFTGLGAAMLLSKAFASFTKALNLLTVTTIPKAIVKFTALKTLIRSPITMPAIAIGAALGAIAAVKKAYDNAVSAIEQKDRQVIDNGNKAAEMMKSARRRYDKGEINEKQFRGIVKAAVGMTSRATGSNYETGGYRWVGEHGPELTYVPPGSRITPAYQSRQQMGAPSRSSPSVVIENYNSYNERDDKKFFSDLGFALENHS